MSSTGNGPTVFVGAMQRAFVPAVEGVTVNEHVVISQAVVDNGADAISNLGSLQRLRDRSRGVGGRRTLRTICTIVQYART